MSKLEQLGGVDRAGEPGAPEERSRGASAGDANRLDVRRLESILDAFERVCLRVVGDVILDEYLWGDVDRVSPEAPVPVVRVDTEAVVLGGAGNVVRNIVALGGSCSFCTVVGDDRDGRTVARLLDELGVDGSGILVASGRTTARKTRVVARAQQVVRFDRESSDELPAAVSRQLVDTALSGLDSLDGVILEDYGKGIFSRRSARRMLDGLRAAELFVAVDPKDDFALFRGASLVKPNLREAELFAGVTVRNGADLDRVATRLRRRLGSSDLVITRGGRGMSIYDGERPARQVPTVAQDVFDVQGAGDTTIAALVLALRAGANLYEAAVIANAAAGVVVQKVGTATASREELRALLPAAARAARGSNGHGSSQEPGSSSSPPSSSRMDA